MQAGAEKLELDGATHSPVPRKCGWPLRPRDVANAAHGVRYCLSEDGASPLDNRFCKLRGGVHAAASLRLIWRIALKSPGNEHPCRYAASYWTWRGTSMGRRAWAPTTPAWLADPETSRPGIEPADRADDGDLEQWCRFHEEVTRLPIEEREVVGLVYYHGWSQTQVAELFQVNVRTVRRWWESALVKLHRELKDEELTGSQS